MAPEGSWKSNSTTWPGIEADDALNHPVNAARSQVLELLKLREQAWSLRGHSGFVYGVAFSSNGKRVATASGDTTVHVYAFDVRELLNLARSRVTRNFTAEECQRYFQSGTCPLLP